MPRELRALPLRVSALALLAALGCGEQAELPTTPAGATAPRSAVLITLDTTRADALGAYGGRPGLTPALDQLAREGVVYEQARTVAPITLPAHASMLTGLYPPRHTARDNSLSPVPPAARTLAELASEQGLETAAFVAAVVLDASFGLDQGFGLYDAPSRALRGGRVGIYDERSGAAVASEAIRWLRAPERLRPFLLWVHLFDPHHPYAPPRELLARAGGDAYLGEVAAADAAVGRILDALRETGLLEETLLLVVGDHGEGLGEHGESSHGVFVYESTLRVPLLVRYPDGYRAGERSREIASVADVFPTLVEALGLGDPGAVDGVSLYRRRVPPDRGVYFESYYGSIHYGWAPLVGWVDAGGKYVHGRPPEFFDVRADPAETESLGEDAPDRAPYLKGISRVIFSQPLAAEGAIDPAMLERLERLGYATAGSRGGLELPDPLAPGDLPNPRDRQAERQRVYDAIGLIQGGQVAEAIRKLEAVLRENPDNATALEFLGSALNQAGRCEEALPVLEKLVERGLARSTTFVNLGGCLLGLGRAEEALAPLEHAHGLEPTDPTPLEGLVRALTALGRDDEAAAARAQLDALSRGS